MSGRKKKIDPDSAHAEALAFLDWAKERFDAEVTKRPVNSAHRHTLEVTWKQVIRKAKERVKASASGN